MTRAKKGIILPIVMVFMVISHLILISVLRYHNINSRHLIRLSHFYQAGIQKHLAMANRYDSIDIKAAVQLAIEKTIHGMEEDIFPYNGSEVIKSKDFKLIITEKEACLVTYQIFINKQYAGLVEDWPAYGFLDQDLKPVEDPSFIASQQAQCDQVISYLLDQGYFLIDQALEEDLDYWEEDLSQSQTIEFNAGYVEFKESQTYPVIEIHLPDHDYQRKDLIEPLKVPYLILQTSYHFDRSD